MLVPRSINNAGIWQGIPHSGMEAVFMSKSARGKVLYETVNKLKELGVKF